MNKKVTSILAYFGIVLWLIAFLAGDKEGAKVHLNQGLVLFLCNVVLGVIAIIPVVGTIIACIGYIVVFVFAIMGIVYACKGEDKELPLIGKIHLLK